MRATESGADARADGSVEVLPDRLIGADLERANLIGSDLSGRDLSRANLRGARLSGANLRDAVLHEADLEGAQLVGADLTNADLSSARLVGAQLGGSTLARANLFGVDATRATFSKANAEGADLRRAMLHEARVLDTDLRAANLSGANLTAADLTGSRVAKASFDDTDLAAARVRDLDGYPRASWIGCDIEDVSFNGAYLLRREIVDQNYLHEFRSQSRSHALLYLVWSLTSDCGRSFGRWGLLNLLVAGVYAIIYAVVDIDFGSYQTLWSPLYFSVVTVTTLGYGDVLPASGGSQMIVLSEVMIGYMMLGGLMSIFANKMGRRGD